MGKPVVSASWNLLKKPATTLLPLNWPGVSVAGSAGVAACLPDIQVFDVLRSSPANKALKQNYSRFAEFYQSYRPKAGTQPKPAVLPIETPPAEAAPAPQNEGGR